MQLKVVALTELDNLEGQLKSISPTHAVYKLQGPFSVTADGRTINGMAALMYASQGGLTVYVNGMPVTETVLLRPLQEVSLRQTVMQKPVVALSAPQTLKVKYDPDIVIATKEGPAYMGSVKDIRIQMLKEGSVGLLA